MHPDSPTRHPLRQLKNTLLLLCSFSLCAFLSPACGSTPSSEKNPKEQLVEPTLRQEKSTPEPTPTEPIHDTTTSPPENSPDASPPENPPTERITPTENTHERITPETSAEQPTEQGPSPGLTIDPKVKAEMANQALVGLAIGVVRDGNIEYLKGYGYADREAKLPVDPKKTMFRWASISKTLVGVISTRLSTQGLLDLDRSIDKSTKDYVIPNTYVEPCTGGTKIKDGTTYTCKDGFFEFPLKSSERVITLRMLLGHLGGIPHYANGKGRPYPTNAEANDPNINTGIAWAIKKYLAPRPLIAIPTSKYSYSTMGLNLAGMVLEQITQQSLISLTQTHIHQIAGLKTLQVDIEWKKIPNRAVGYRNINGVNLRDGSDDVSWKLPGGGFISTLEDMALYCKALMGDRLLNKAQKTIAWTSQKTRAGSNTSYGLTFTSKLTNSRPYIAHSGSQQKSKTLLRLYTKEKLCIVIMSNSTQADVYKVLKAVEEGLPQP